MLDWFICDTHVMHNVVWSVGVKNFSDAEASCQNQGGHLTSYQSEAEQAEVEQYYIKNGYLFPTFAGHQFYWMGLNASFWPSTGFAKFHWLDRSPGPNNSTYQHWGTYYDAYSAVPEPNNARSPPENCAGANITQAYGARGAWGWADWNCTASFGYMCRMLREWPC
jgi:hypothetical protein